jgi:hypothetical protein
MFGRLKSKVSRTKLKHQDDGSHDQTHKHSHSYTNNGFLSPGGPSEWVPRPPLITWDNRLNDHPRILTKIFGYVCPHSKDRSYESANNVPLPDGTCMYCDLWTLKNCVLVCRAWRRVAQQAMYVPKVPFCTPN